MLKRLIINGDDFGFSEAFNYGVIHAFEHGVLTSTSLMSNMDGAVHAAALAKMHPRLCISQHTNIVQGKCCCDPASIPSIAREDGSFYRSTEYQGKGMGGTRIPDKEDVKREARAQLERFKTLLGYYPVHMEGHSIGGETMMQGLFEVAQEYGIHCMTFLPEPQPGFIDVGYVFDAGYMDVLNSGEEKTEAFIAFLERIKDTGFETCAVHLHPGYVDATIMDNSTLVLPRCRDLQLLCDVRLAQWLGRNHIELVRYDQIRAT